MMRKNAFSAIADNVSATFAFAVKTKRLIYVKPIQALV